MNEEKLEEIRQALLRLRAELRELDETSKEAGATVELDQAKVGRLSRMDALQAQQMAKEAARRRQHRMLAIDGALRRIETGEYGDCFICGNEIDARRLSIDPASTRCMECAGT
jgi:DnaK suppressor protein